MKSILERMVDHKDEQNVIQRGISKAYDDMMSVGGFYKVKDRNNHCKKIQDIFNERKKIMKFYNYNGTEISKEDFITNYSNSYFCGGNRVKKVTQNSRFVECEIEKLLQCGIKESLDVVHILAWKIGKIKHADSDKYQRFMYYKDWTNAEKFEMKLYGKMFDAKAFIDYIADNITELEKQAKNDPQGVLNHLNERSSKGVGSVYLITLLYFISKGKYPIYDRFAMMSLDAIIGNIKPYTEKVTPSDLPEKNSKKFEKIFDMYNDKYIKKIKQIFGKSYWETRNIDRALWVYGHAFSK